MSDKSFLNTFSGGFLIGGTIFGFLIAAFWLDERIRDLDERICDLDERACDEIEVLSSRLEEKP